MELFTDFVIKDKNIDNKSIRYIDIFLLLNLKKKNKILITSFYILYNFLK